MFRESQNLPIFDKGVELAPAHQDKPDEYRCPYQLGHIYAGIGAQGMEDVLCPASKVYFLESKAVERPEDGSGLKPHLVKDKMGEGAEGKDKEPGFATTSVQVKSGKGDEDEKEKGMAKYPAVAKGISKKELTYGFINDVGEKRA